MILAVQPATVSAVIFCVALISLLITAELLRAGGSDDARIRTINWGAVPLLAVFTVIVAARLVSFA